jgi:hypothetical protein
MNRKLATALLISLLLVTLAPAAALAAAPSNDNAESATEIDASALPFSDVVDTTEATRQADEPGSPCSFAQHTVWYRITAPRAGAMLIDPSGSTFFDTAITVYLAGAPVPAGLSVVNCANFGALTTRVDAGFTYFVAIGDIFGGGGVLSMRIEMVPPPANDDVADASQIGSLPFSDTYDLTSATREPTEPIAPCASASPTVWYAFDSTVDATLTAAVSDFGSNIAVYRGTNFGDLTLVDCAAFRVSTFDALVGERFYFQVGGQFDQARFGSFSLTVTPPPHVTMLFGPGDPSVFDTVQFNALVQDPGGIGVEQLRWDFGDGSTGSGFGATHAYVADGDYTVELTATTFDGRSASTTQVLQVRTHDVAISKLSVPNSASSGQTRSITVGIANRRYPESVTVTLLRLTPAGPVQVGSLTQAVPVRTGNRTTDFAFSYTFTADDARVGKVSFQAVATINGARDAIPGDNQAQSLPTKVTR